MNRIEVDVAVIGAGTAGLSARREAEKQGASTLLIEAGPYGTTCARVGCMPSKLLIAAADVAHELGQAHQFGIELQASPRVDGSRVLERVRRERDRFAGFVVRDTEALPKEQRLRGRAVFIGPTALEVDGRTQVEARAVVVAAGTRPFIPPELDSVRDRVLTNDNVFELQDLPESVAVLGAGIIGLELGQALHRLGVHVEVFVRSDRLGPLRDPELQNELRGVFGAELPLRLQTKIESAEPDGEGVRLHWRDAADGANEGRFDYVLAATGRHPNLADLQLEQAKLELDPRGVPVFDPRTMQAGASAVFLAGDVVGQRALLHEAADEGRIAGFNAAGFPDVAEHVRRTPLAIVFTDPQIAMVGQPLAELESQKVEIGEVDYGDQGRARVMAKNAGRVRVYADRSSGKLLGAEMFGPRVEHTAHLLAWVIQQGLRVDRILEMPFYHPVIEEGIRTALRDVSFRLQLTPKPCAGDLDCGPGA